MVIRGMLANINQFYITYSCQWYYEISLSWGNILLIKNIRINDILAGNH